MILKYFEKYAGKKWTAEEWYIRNQNPDLSEADCIAFLSWLEENPKNEAEYSRVEMVSSLMSQSALELSPSVSEAPSQNAVNRTLIWRRALAATVAAILLLNLLPIFDGIQDYQTAVGEQRLVVLEDGSSVRLNTSTKVSVDFDKSDRLISLKGGEAFFNVQKDPKDRPFLVEVDGSIVKAVGTEFNIRLNDNSLTVSVLEGVVEILESSDSSKAPQLMSTLTEGYKVIVDSVGVSKPEKITPNRNETAWTEGWVRFESTPLKSAVKEVNRYSDVKLVIVDSKLDNLIVGGTFKTRNSEQFARSLAEVLPISVKNIDGVLMLSSKAEAIQATE